MAAALKMNHQGQVHRVLLREGDVTYETVQDSIQKIYPSEPIVAKYVDEDGDHCTLTEASFTDFLSLSGERNGTKILKLELTVKTAGCPDDGGREGRKVIAEAVGCPDPWSEPVAETPWDKGAGKWWNKGVGAGKGACAGKGKGKGKGKLWWKGGFENADETEQFAQSNAESTEQVAETPWHWDEGAGNGWGKWWHKLAAKGKGKFGKGKLWWKGGFENADETEQVAESNAESPEQVAETPWHWDEGAGKGCGKWWHKLAAKGKGKLGKGKLWWKGGFENADETEQVAESNAESPEQVAETPWHWDEGAGKDWGMWWNKGVGKGEGKGKGKFWGKGGFEHELRPRKIKFLIWQLHQNGALDANSAAALCIQFLPKLISHVMNHSPKIDWKVKMKFPELKSILEDLRVLVASTPGLQQCECKFADMLANDGNSASDTLMELLTALNTLPVEAQVAFFTAFYNSQEPRLLEKLDGMMPAGKCCGKWWNKGAGKGKGKFGKGKLWWKGGFENADETEQLAQSNAEQVAETPWHWDEGAGNGWGKWWNKGAVKGKFGKGKFGKGKFWWNGGFENADETKQLSLSSAKEDEGDLKDAQKQLEEMGLGDGEVLMELLRNHDGSMQRVVEELTMEGQ